MLATFSLYRQEFHSPIQLLVNKKFFQESSFKFIKTFFISPAYIYATLFINVGGKSPGRKVLDLAATIPGVPYLINFSLPPDLSPEAEWYWNGIEKVFLMWYLPYTTAKALHNAMRSSLWQHKPKPEIIISTSFSLHTFDRGMQDIKIVLRIQSIHS